MVAVSKAIPWVSAGAIVAALGFASVREAEGGDTLDDGVPSGTVAFFAPGSQCPPGWGPATAVGGRMIVGVTNPAAVGRTVNAPLGDREDRAHTHPYTTSLTLAPRAIAGANGPNQQGAASGSYTVSGRTRAAASGNAFVQLRACVKR